MFHRFNQKIRDAFTFGHKPDAFLCVFVGRISREKRIDVLVDALRGIPGAYLAIVGDGPSASVYGSLHGDINRVYCQVRVGVVYIELEVDVELAAFPDARRACGHLCKL